MKGMVLIVLMIVLTVAGWRVGNQLSSDAVSMAVGILFGVVAGVPTALMVLASARRRGNEEDDAYGRSRHGTMGYMPQPPVIVVTGTPNGQQMQDQRALPPPHAMHGQTIDAREFKVVGEKEEWIDEW